MITARDQQSIIRISLLLTVLFTVIAWEFGEADGRIFQHLLARHDVPAGILMAILLLLPLWLLRGPVPSTSIVEELSALPLAAIRRRYWIAGALGIALSAGTLFLYADHPLSMDEYAAKFQAQVFSTGKLAASYPPEFLEAIVPMPFQGSFLTIGKASGEIASSYWPGFSLILTPFVWLGIPWACNPALVALSVLVIGRLTEDISGSKEAAGWALLFSTGSAAFLLNGITYYSMPAHLLLNACYAWLLLRPTSLRLFLAGLVGSLALVLHNPFPHTLFALPWLAWLVWRKEPLTDKWKGLGAIALGYLPLLLLLGIGWIIFLKGLAAQSSLPVAAPPSSSSFLSASTGASNLATPFAARSTLTRHFQTPTLAIVEARIMGTAKLWLWSAPLLPLLAFLGMCQRRKSAAANLLAASALATYAGYFLIPFDQGHGWGYRYFHSAWFALPVFAALYLVGRPASSDPKAPRSQPVLPWVGAVTIMAGLLLVPLRAGQIASFVSAHLSQMPPGWAEPGTLVVRYRGGYYGLDLIQSDPRRAPYPKVLHLINPRQERSFMTKFFSDWRTVSSNQYGATYRRKDDPAAPTANAALNAKP